MSDISFLGFENCSIAPYLFKIQPLLCQVEKQESGQQNNMYWRLGSHPSSYVPATRARCALKPFKCVARRLLTSHCHCDHCTRALFVAGVNKSHLLHNPPSSMAFKASSCRHSQAFLPTRRWWACQPKLINQICYPLYIIHHHHYLVAQPSFNLPITTIGSHIYHHG